MRDLTLWKNNSVINIHYTSSPLALANSYIISIYKDKVLKFKQAGYSSYNYTLMHETTAYIYLYENEHQVSVPRICIQESDKTLWTLTSFEERGTITSVTLNWLAANTLGVLSYHVPSSTAAYLMLSILKKAAVGWQCRQTIKVPLSDRVMPKFHPRFLWQENAPLIDRVIPTHDPEVVLIWGINGAHTELLFLNTSIEQPKHHWLIDNQQLVDFCFHPTITNILIARDKKNIFILDLKTQSGKKLENLLSSDDELFSMGMKDGLLQVQTGSGVKPVFIEAHLWNADLLLETTPIAAAAHSIIFEYMSETTPLILKNIIHSNIQKGIPKVIPAVFKESNEESGYFQNYKSALISAITRFRRDNQKSLPTFETLAANNLYTYACNVLSLYHSGYYQKQLYERVDRILASKKYTTLSHYIREALGQMPETLPLERRKKPQVTLQQNPVTPFHPQIICTNLYRANQFISYLRAKAPHLTVLSKVEVEDTEITLNTQELYEQFQNFNQLQEAPRLLEFNIKKDSFQKRFTAQLDEFKKRIALQQKKEPTLYQKNLALHADLIKAQEVFLEGLKPEASPQIILKNLHQFRNTIDLAVDQTDKVMGHGWLYRVAEVFIKSILGLLASGLMLLGALGGQGLLKPEHRRQFKDSFFTWEQTQSRGALKHLKAELLGIGTQENLETESSCGLLALQNIPF